MGPSRSLSKFLGLSCATQETTGPYLADRDCLLSLSTITEIHDEMYAIKTISMSEKMQQDAKPMCSKLPPLSQGTRPALCADRNDCLSVSSDSTAPEMFDDPFAYSASETSEDTQTWYWETVFKDKLSISPPSGYRPSDSPPPKHYRDQTRIPTPTNEPHFSIYNRNFASDNLSNLALSAPPPTPVLDLHRSDAFRYPPRITTSYKTASSATYSPFPKISPPPVSIHKQHKSWPSRTPPAQQQQLHKALPARPRANTTPPPSSSKHLQYRPSPPSSLSTCTTLTQPSPCTSSLPSSPLYMSMRAVSPSPGPAGLHPRLGGEHGGESEKSVFETDDDEDDEGEGGLSPFGSLRRRLMGRKSEERDEEAGKEKEKEKTSDAPEMKEVKAKRRRVSDVLKGVFGIKRVV